jgi:ABC-type amino acid transport system permease subunit
VNDLPNLVIFPVALSIVMISLYKQTKKVINDTSLFFNIYIKALKSRARDYDAMGAQVCRNLQILILI